MYLKEKGFEIGVPGCVFRWDRGKVPKMKVLEGDAM
jgi:hypothetical protein